MNRVKEIRLKHGVTQAEIAEVAGVSQRAVSQWETGKTDPSAASVSKIAAKYGEDAETIIFEDTKKETMSPAVPMDDDEMLLYDLLHRLPEEKRKKAVTIMQRTAELLL